MSTTPEPDSAKQLEILLQCSVCSKTLTQPRTLPCYHSFCKHCLENYVAAQCEKAVEASAKEPEIFECPLCRTKFSVKEVENVGEKMPANHFINNLLELLSIQQQAHHVKCQSCKAKAPAASRCMSCEKYLCGKCLETHNNWPVFEEHVVLTLEELAKPENRAKAKDKSRCEKHDKFLEFYCETCKVLVCRDCVDLNHTRPEHAWFPLADVVVQHKDALNAYAGIFQKQNNDAAESNRKIEEAMEDLKFNSGNAKHAIKKEHQNILDAFAKRLEKETRALLDEVDMKFTEAKETLLKQHADVKSYSEKAKSSLVFTRSILCSGSVEEIPALKHEIEEKAGSIENERPEYMEPVHDGLFEFYLKPTADFIKDLKLKGYGKIYSPRLKNTGVQADPVVQSLCDRSTILKGNLEHAKQLVKWVKYKKFGWQLCYRASRDGWGAEDFRRMCADVGPTVTLVKCGTNIFGGFTDQSWKLPSRKGFPQFKQSTSSFLFTIENEENLGAIKFPIKEGQIKNAILCHPLRGAVFGSGRDLSISDNANTNEDSYSNLGFTYQSPPQYRPGTQETKALLAGRREFTPSEIEVFSNTTVIKLDDVTLKLDAGCVSTDTEITLTASSTRNITPKSLLDLGLVDAIVRVVELLPDGVKFLKPAVLMIRFEMTVSKAEHFILHGSYNCNCRKTSWEVLNTDIKKDNVKGVLSVKINGCSFYTFILARRGVLARILCHFNDTFVCRAYALYRTKPSIGTIDIAVILVSEFVDDNEEDGIKQLKDHFDRGYLTGEKGGLKRVHTDRDLQISLSFPGLESRHISFKINQAELDSSGYAISSDFLEIGINNPANGKVKISEVFENTLLWTLFFGNNGERASEARKESAQEERRSARDSLPGVVHRTTKLTNGEICQISKKVGLDWDCLAGLLDIPYYEREEIRFHYTKFSSKAEQVLQRFNASKSFDRNTLEKCFHELNRGDLSKDLERPVEREDETEDVQETRSQSQAGGDQDNQLAHTPLSSRELYRLSRLIFVDWDCLAALLEIVAADRNTIRTCDKYKDDRSRAEKALSVFNRSEDFSRVKLADCLREINQDGLIEPVLRGDWRNLVI
ncbi:uncharacterized protein LOC114516826 [Dendronephthya gigantea]|uniref:uncharacterized protein LOC114516826 n=1 Tax=Dendronephthya gigantea TaxID=151771 RepID=UPI00106B77F9|nr:uncharacterized protein LOC114516826 [Dendronephthya gigantea]